MMTSKERVLAAIHHKQPDRCPVDFAATMGTMDNLKKHYGFENNDQVFDHFESDIRFVDAVYQGPKLKDYIDTDGLHVDQNFWGWTQKWYWNGHEYNPMNLDFPLNDAETVEDIDAYNWPQPDWFDYEAVKRQCDKYEDKAILIGHAGVYQFSTFLRSAENLYMDMILDPDLVHSIFNHFVDFEVEYYERILQAGDGRINILRCYDDYGTQTSMLFSKETWREFFFENTRRLTQLAKKYGAHYMQHSCGAIRPIIPQLIEAGVELLDPIQMVTGLEPEGLKQDFGKDLCFHGGIDTQGVLPLGTPQEVADQTKHFIETLNVDGGYILYSSQELQADVPIENIEALYGTNRN